MKWFKHNTTMAMEQISKRIIEKHGFAGYGRYMVILEQIALEINKTSQEATYTMTAKSWGNLLGYRSPKQVIEFINELQEIGALEVLKPELMDKNGQKVNADCTQSVTKNALKPILNQVEMTLSAPKLLYLKDEYSRKSGACPDTIKDKKEDIDKEKDIKTSCSSNDEPAQKSDGFDQVKGFALFWDSWKNRVGKASAKTRYRATVKTQKAHDRLMRNAGNYEEYVTREGHPWKHGSTFMGEWREWDAVPEPPPKPETKANSPGGMFADVPLPNLTAEDITF